MARTIAEAVLQIRQVVQDSREGSYRHDDDKIISYFNNAVADARRLRPDLFLVPSITPIQGSLWAQIPTFTADDISAGTVIPIPDMYFSPLVDYVAGTLGMEDDEFAVDGRAVALLNRFTQKLTAKGA